MSSARRWPVTFNRWVERFAHGGLCVGELAAPLAMSLVAASKHTQVLERAGVLRVDEAHRDVPSRFDESQKPDVAVHG